jgi:4-amino-4-deoxy-L-arabinose transferase-like glycosyltransferase
MEEVKGELKESVSEKEIEKRKDSIKKKFSSWIKDNCDKVLIALLVISFIIRILIFIKTMNQPLWWDEADYLSAAKKWGIGINVGDIWYYRRGFLWPLIGALFFKLGIGEISMRFLVVLLSTGTVALSYFVIAKMFDKKSALLVSIGIAFSWISLFFTGRVLTDIPGTFVLLLALLFFWKGYVLKEGNRYLYLFGLFYALALLVRFQFAMFAIPILIFIFTREKF